MISKKEDANAADQHIEDLPRVANSNRLIGSLSGSDPGPAWPAMKDESRGKRPYVCCYFMFVSFDSWLQFHTLELSGMP